MKLDEQIEWVGKEINFLRGKTERWAQSKVAALQAIEESLRELRSQQPLNRLGAKLRGERDA